ncbi:hypothetical protein [Plantactinospora soyae]|uniref:Uncharacterized protein n=1 Tax=Plantactinospora soyae TaxID=1544732 RepID=A0A927MCN7_9ACTN|nr:hypothetical protein [Plantactinospora soyae]MBE1492157.1 hypothetical protein [Plantactinospora soyae]
MTGLRVERASVVWRLLVAVDVVVVTVFAVTAAIEPYQVLEDEGMEIQNFQGLLPTVIVVVLRWMVLAAERRLLAVAQGRLVFAGRVASLIGFYYLAQWMFHDAYGRWYEVVLGYALVGVAGLGLAALVYHLPRLWSVRSARSPRPDDGSTSEVATTTSEVATTRESLPAAGRRGELTRASLFDLVGVFLGVTGLLMSVTDMSRLGLAVFVGVLAVGGIALFHRRRQG